MYSSIYKLSCTIRRSPKQKIPLHLYGASALMTAANSGSHLSPLASNFSEGEVSDVPHKIT